ncbi:GAF and ANTAR domain-containing protein [Streptomyces sp. NPDC047071]|uniref:GAF and ANTAR domain-containing protein n=1 Tax=Streptomyces sp. NPDC047071 TaxID=3154808 RepID=UPI0034547888
MRADRPGGDASNGSSGAGRRRVGDALAAAVAAANEPREVPAALCRGCLELIAVSGASLSFIAGQEVRALWWASDPVAAGLAEAQYTLGEGPCQSAFTLAAPVLVGDLTSGAHIWRWPVFAQQARGLGARAVFSLPLGAGARPLGTLDLYRDTAGDLSPRELRTALIVCDAVTFAVLDLGFGATGTGAAPDEKAASWIEAAEAGHMEVHQAVGMVMVQLGVGPQYALDLLRARAFAEGRGVSEVAREVVGRRLRFRRDDDNGGGPGPAAGGSTDEGPH